MPTCHKCSKKAIIYQRYSGMLLCQTHFDEDVNRKIRESLRRTMLFAHSAHIAIALGGGTDSSTLLFALKNIFLRRKDIEFTAVILDEGPEAYRESRLEWSVSLAKKLDVPFITRNIDGAVEMPAQRCEAEDPCGNESSQRQRILQETSAYLGADALALDHTLDDEALFIFRQLAKGGIEELSQLQKADINKQQVPIIKPLHRIPAREARLYAIIHEIASPFDLRARSSKPDALLKGEVERMLDDFDSRHPGTKYSLLRSLDRIIDLQDTSQRGAKPLCEDSR